MKENVEDKTGRKMKKQTPISNESHKSPTKRRFFQLDGGPHHPLLFLLLSCFCLFVTGCGNGMLEEDSGHYQIVPLNKYLPNPQLKLDKGKSLHSLKSYEKLKTPFKGTPFTKRKSTLPKIIAHRGASGVAPENTMIAGKKALMMGAHAWEFDVRITKDSKLVLMHDRSLKRTTNVKEAFPKRAPWYVESFTSSELNDLSNGSWFPAKSEADEIVFEDEQIASLDTALRWTKRVRWRAFVELKYSRDVCTPAYYAKKVYESLKRTQTTKDVLIISFSGKVLQELKKLDKSVQTGLLYSRTFAAPVKKVKALQLSALLLNKRVVAKYPIQKLQRAGVKVFTYTANKMIDLKRLSTLGLDGIITDYPDRLKKLNAQRSRFSF